jgi:hypothetical protein
MPDDVPEDNATLQPRMGHDRFVSERLAGAMQTIEENFTAVLAQRVVQLPPRWYQHRILPPPSLDLRFTRHISRSGLSVAPSLYVLLDGIKLIL